MPADSAIDTLRREPTPDKAAFPFGSLRTIKLDLAFFSALLILCGAIFYLGWDVWRDQAAQVYMAWGLFHGMRPYVDLVDPNWPGILVPHVVAYLLSGIDGWGVRVVDLFALLILLGATSYVLAAWSVPLTLRLTVGVAYLVNYFGTGWCWTAQRESFGWPLFIMGSIPFLLELGPKGTDATSEFSNWSWFISGLISGFGLWNKPTPCVTLFFLMATWIVIGNKNAKGSKIRKLLVYLAGLACVSAVFIVALIIAGAMPGFWKWGILYDLGPYSKIKWPWPTRLRMTLAFETDLENLAGAAGYSLDRLHLSRHAFSPG